MNIKQLEIFLLIARIRNFTRAAAQLGMSQPAVSSQIKSLEEELNITLFERADKKVVLTEAGRLLFPIAMQMMRQYNKIKASIDDLREVKAGHLMLGATSVPGEWLLPPVIGGFREQYPGITVSQYIGGSTQVTEWLKKQEVEIGILGAPVKAEGVECMPWTTDRMVIITPPWHPLKGKEVPLTALTSDPVIVRENGSGVRKTMEHQFLEHNVSLDQFSSMLELGSTQAVINAVRLGLGISVVSRFAAGELLDAGMLGEVKVAGLNLSCNFYLAWSRPDKETLASKAFRAFITDEEIIRRFTSYTAFYDRSKIAATAEK